jgi:hypothetical protein
MSRKRFIILSSINNYKRQSTSSIKLNHLLKQNSLAEAVTNGKAAQEEKENVFWRILDRIGDF